MLTQIAASFNIYHRPIIQCKMVLYAHQMLVHTHSKTIYQLAQNSMKLKFKVSNRISKFSARYFINKCFRASEVSWNTNQRIASRINEKQSSANASRTFNCLIFTTGANKKKSKIVSNILFTCVHSIECVIHTNVAVVLLASFVWNFVSTAKTQCNWRIRKKKNTYMLLHSSIPSQIPFLFSIESIEMDFFFASIQHFVCKHFEYSTLALIYSY